MINTSHAIATLVERIAADPADAELRYRIAVLQIEDHLATQDPQQRRRASEHLLHALKLQPTNARVHATFGYLCDVLQNDTERALDSFREASRLKPEDRVYDVYRITLLQEAGREAEALAEIRAAAARHEVDVSALERELKAAAFPTDAAHLLMNGFIHPRNFFRSALDDEAERIRNALQPGGKRREAVREGKRCAESQRVLQRQFDPSQVPEELASLNVWASRYGVGDDYCRAYLIRRLSAKDRRALTKDVNAHARPIHSWLDSFGDAAMPAEAAAFMYLALAVEEIQAEP